MGLMTVNKGNSQDEASRKPRMTKQEFFDKAKEKYGDRYSYSKTKFKSRKYSVVVTCPIHGDFEVKAESFLNGVECKSCSFISKARDKHGDKYDYSKVQYTHSTTNVVIICPIHGEFECRPADHLRTLGCSKCGDKAKAGDNKKTTEEFIEEAAKVHNNKYGYGKTLYTRSDEDVTIVCAKHGEFTQVASTHLQGKGCPACGEAKRKSNMWSYSDWEKAGKASSMFEGFSLYIIQCTGNGEKFIKVGKTFRGVAKRFAGDKDMPYKYKVITQVYHNAYAISKLEEKLHRHFKEYKYKPKREFAGMHECYDLCILEEAIEKAEK